MSRSEPHGETTAAGAARGAVERQRRWMAKFRHAFRGIKRGMRGQSSFAVHLFAATAVVAAGWALEVTRLDWCLLLAAIGGVLTAEMFNSALEALARNVTREEDPAVADALDIGSGAVLLAALTAAALGVLVLLPRLVLLFGG